MAGEGGKRGSPKITLMYGVWMGASISYGTLLNALTHRSATVGTLLTASYMAAGLGHFKITEESSPIPSLPKRIHWTPSVHTTAAEPATVQPTTSCYHMGAVKNTAGAQWKLMICGAPL